MLASLSKNTFLLSRVAEPQFQISNVLVLYTLTVLIFKCFAHLNIIQVFRSQQMSETKANIGTHLIEREIRFL